jgi:hypothetical protein
LPSIVSECCLVLYRTRSTTICISNQILTHKLSSKSNQILLSHPVNNQNHLTNHSIHPQDVITSRSPQTSIVNNFQDHQTASDLFAAYREISLQKSISILQNKNQHQKTPRDKKILYNFSLWLCENPILLPHITITILFLTISPSFPRQCVRKHFDKANNLIYM